MAIADSLLALIAGASTAYSNTQARRGEEERATRRALVGDRSARQEREAEREERRVAREQAAAAEERRFEESKRSARETEENRAARLDIDRAALLDRQDSQNRIAALQQQLQGVRDLLAVVRASKTTKEKDPEELLRKLTIEGAARIFANPDISTKPGAVDRATGKAGPSDAENRVRAFLQTIQGLSGEDAPSEDSATQALLEALSAAQDIAGGAEGGGVEDFNLPSLDVYPRSGLYNPFGSPSDSEFDLYTRANPKLRALAPSR